MLDVVKKHMQESADGSQDYVSNLMSDDSWMNDEERALFERAMQLKPLLAERESQCQSGRAVPQATVAEFHRAGVARILQPRRYGGMEGRTLLLSRVVEELSMACASSAWVLAVFGEHAWMLASLPEQGQEEIWGNNPHAVAASSLAPRAVAQRVDGGYRISGTYPFASGCKNAEWIIVGAWVEKNGKQERYFLLVPSSQVEILDDWQALGMRGTGSNTIALKDVFVPDHLTLADADMARGEAPGRKLHPDFKLLQVPRTAFGVWTHVPVTFALARRALRHVSVNMRGRVSRGNINMHDSQIVHMKIGEAAADIEGAILVATERHKRTWERVDAGHSLGRDELAVCMRDSVWANRMARRGIETLVSVSSAEITHDRNVLQMLYRDALTTGSHFSANWDAAASNYGRIKIELPA